MRRPAVAFMAVLACGQFSTAADSNPPAADLPERSVTLPLTEYNNLLALAERSAKRPEPPPVSAVLSSVVIRAVAGNEIVRGSMTFEGEVLRKGPAEVQLVGAAPLLRVRSAKGPVPMHQRDGRCFAVIDGPGPFSIELDWAGQVFTEAGRARFEIAVPEAACVKASFELPVETADAHVEPGIVTSRSGGGGRTAVEATLEGGTWARIWWASHESASVAAQKPSRLLSDVKSLVTMGEAGITLSAFIDVTVLQGEPSRLELLLPEGYEVTSATGNSINTVDTTGNGLAINVREPSRRRHRFLVSIERGAVSGGTTPVRIAMPTVERSQRETGEAAIEGEGTIELEATVDEGVHRIDVAESAAALREMAREPLLAAFRYQRKGVTAPVLKLDAKRFPDSAVLAAVAERAVVTTLVTMQGGMLHEVALSVRNQGRPYMKTVLPEGAMLLSAEVAGVAVKPVKGADGTRIPLLRTGHRPLGVYDVSYVYMQAANALGKGGKAQLVLPAMDIPISILEWELFAPDKYELKKFGGEAIKISEAAVVCGGAETGVASAATTGTMKSGSGGVGSASVAGKVADMEGGVLPGVTVTLTGDAGQRRTQTTDVDGRFSFSMLPPGRYDILCELEGFAAVLRKEIRVGSDSGVSLSFAMNPNQVAEVVTVVADSPVIDTKKSGVGQTFGSDILQNVPTARDPWVVMSKVESIVEVSSNVTKLQRRVAGVLPIRIEIPRAGTSYRFIRPLVLDETTSVSFEYRTR